MNVKEYLHDVLFSENEPDIYDLPYQLKIENWPQIPEEGYPDSLEPLDTENFEWLSITDDELVICAGGDWQDPLILTIVMDIDHLTVIDTKPGWEIGISEEEVLELLK
jgi:hypothetical protein